MNDIERECIILNSAWETIDGMVNWEIFQRDDNVNIGNLFFNTISHGRLFNILLVDFLSPIQSNGGGETPLGLERVPTEAGPIDRTFLFHLRRVCANPQLGDLNRLGIVVEEFARWLEGEFKTEQVNFGNANLVSDIEISRIVYIKICGDIAKHSIERLDRNINRIDKVLKNNCIKLDRHNIYMSLEDFYSWFHNNIFVYHSSIIAEFLNNIRWEIYRSLIPEFCRSYHETGEKVTGFNMYSYRYPEGCDEEMARFMYWDLMNRVRSKPWIKPFVISDAMKAQY